MTGIVQSLPIPVPVALGGTNAATASITAFNNITGYTASGATGTTSTNLVFSTSPTLTGQAIIQSTTGTSPGWYSQLTGDTVPRIRIGLNASDVASIGFGSGSTTRDLFLERNGAASLRVGTADAAAPVAQTINVQGVVTGTSNTAGVALTFQGSVGTGSAAGGSIIFQTAPAGGSGTSPNALVTALTIAGSGAITTAKGIIISQGNLQLPATSSYTWNGRGVVSSKAAGSIQIGDTDAASPVAQTLSFQSVVTATSNTAGANTIITASNGTGTGGSGTIAVQTAPVAGSGSTPNTLATVFTFGTAGVIVASGKTLTLGNAATTGLTAGVLAAITNASIVITDSTGQAYRIPCIV